MSLLESLRIALAGATANKLRAVLTTLGVVIGVGTVIALVSISQGASGLITAQIEGLGTNMLVVMPANVRVNLTLADAEMLAARVPALTDVVPVLSARGTVKFGLNSHDSTVEGATGTYLTVRNHHLAQGRFINDGDVALNRRVAVIGHEVQTELFRGRNAVGEELSVNGQRFLIVGVLAEKGQSLGQNQDNLVIVPLSTAQRLIGTVRLTAIYGQLGSGDDAPAAVAQIQQIFTKHFGRSGQVRVQSQDELLSTVSSMTRTLSLMLGAIAGISLVVGGIGIMNIMLVSVTERTREIGLRKAVGARRMDILRQFLFEALFISLIGAAIGMVLGTGLAAIIARLGGWSSSVSASSVVLALAFAGAVGIGFGLYPAMRAAALDPIQALRWE